MSQIVLKKYGAGSTALIAFPGWIYPIENEDAFLTLLSEKYAVYSVCIPGYVGVKDASSIQSFTSLAKELHKQLKTISEKKIAFLGFSMGCRLLMTLEHLYPSKHKKILVGCPVKNYQTPTWASVLLKNSQVLHILRKSNAFKLFMVTKALVAISQNKQASFYGYNISLTGAFDSLIGLIQSTPYFEDHANSALFLYGEHDPYLEETKQHSPKHLRVITKAGHNCVKNNEEKIVSAIDLFIS